MSKLEEYEIIDGKPFGGHWYGSWVRLTKMLSSKVEEDPSYMDAVQRLRTSLPKDFEIRNEKIIYKPPYYCDPLNQVITLGIKALVWGRAFKIMKLTSKGVKSYKKGYVSGRRKKVRS